MKAILVCLNSSTNKVPVQLDWERGGFNACCRRGANSLATPVGGAGINCNICLIHSLLLRAKRHNGKRNQQPKKAQASQKSGALIYKLPSVSICCYLWWCCLFLSYSVGLQHPPQEKSLAFRSFLFRLFKCCSKNVLISDSYW